MEELLLSLRDIPSPVIVAGDLNTTGGDSSPTSIQKQTDPRLKSGSFWTTTGTRDATGFRPLYDLVTQGV